ncbi:uncharacterized protein LOC128241154 [Mya arenaria]|uniref:uncharacterized protein LOC128241154 n=1 Tax=Mya arenaria TaxID=6604 RepID=UPI0022E42F22|nr:uncharacterized protein LOC128241154 [Mya arenaria]
MVKKVSEVKMNKKEELRAIGNGVFARQELLKGQFILEYRGELCKQQSDGDEMFKYHFRHNNKEYCIDASKDTCLACMVNDLDRYTKPNCKMVKVVDDRHQPRLCLYATEMISKDTELRYDYGVADVPWRKRKMLLKMVIQLQILQRSQKHLKMPSVNQQKSWNMLIMILIQSTQLCVSNAVGNSGTVAPSTVAPSTVVSEHAEGPPQDAVKDGHTAADTTEVTETSEDALGESAEVLEHAYHDAVEIRGIVYHPQLSLNMLKGRLKQCSRFDPGAATVLWLIRVRGICGKYLEDIFSARDILHSSRKEEAKMLLRRLYSCRNNRDLRTISRCSWCINRRSEVDHAYLDATGNNGTVAPSTVISEHAEGLPESRNVQRLTEEQGQLLRKCRSVQHYNETGTEDDRLY